MPDIIIIPNRGTTSNPLIQLSGSASSSIRIEVLPEGQIAFLGKSGSLFSISDSLVGSLMSVNDMSGLPILEVFSDDRVVMGKFNSNALVVSGSSVGVGTTPASGALLTLPSAHRYEKINLGGGSSAHNIGTENWHNTYGATSGLSSPAAVGHRFYVHSGSVVACFGYGDGTAIYRYNSYLSGALAINKATASAMLDVRGDIFVTGSILDQIGNVRSIPLNAQSALYTLTTTDNGKYIYTTASITVPAGTLPVGFVTTIVNSGSANLSVLTGSLTMTMRQTGTTSTGNRVLGSYGMATVLCVKSDVFYVSGTGVS
jgi:hypothetical protein